MNETKTASPGRGRSTIRGHHRAFRTDDQRWQALRHRDPSADGRFLYSVVTTGVFCRPTCPAKLARRENIVFHENCAAARSAGFRPCKRCQPEGKSQPERHVEAVARACRIIADSETSPTLAALARDVDLSPFHFQRLFKRILGVTPRQYAMAQRTGRVRAELRTRPTVTDAIFGAGYNSSSRFYERSTDTLGMTPGEFRSGGGGVTIQYTVAPSSLGQVLVAGTARGICAVSFGDRRTALENDLRRQFPRATIKRGGKKLNGWVKAIVAHVQRPAGNIDLPLDIRGTAFQQRVWQALRKIPAGRTASYAEVAAAIGRPKAARAVARACATNPAAVLVPCHRVVRGDGEISGYRWGRQRKRELLHRERP